MVDDGKRNRLQRVLADADLPGDEAVPLESYSNDAWDLGELILRICWQGNTGRLERERILGLHLPSEVRYPEVVSCGRTGDLSWMVVRRVPGERLDHAWPRLDDSQQQRAIEQLGGCLSALHAWVPSSAAREALARRDPDTDDAMVLATGELNPLSVARALRVAGHARRLPAVDGALIDAVEERLRQLAPLDPFVHDEAGVVVHGDAHLANVLWHQGQTTALLDLEWARWGPRDLELEPLLRSVDYTGHEPELFSQDEMRRILRWLAAAYPPLFQHPELVRRLWLYQLTFTLRELFTWPMPSSVDAASPDHPLNRLPMFLADDGHIARLID